MRKRCICFLLSDFLATGYEKALRLSNKRHDMIALTISDPREQDLPRVGFVELEDAETGETILLDTRDSQLLAAYRALWERLGKERTRLFRSMNMDSVGLSTHVSFAEPLLAFFRLREKRL
jgi:hypothetical protein